MGFLVGLNIYFWRKKRVLKPPILADFWSFGMAKHLFFWDFWGTFYLPSSTQSDQKLLYKAPPPPKAIQGVFVRFLHLFLKKKASFQSPWVWPIFFERFFSFPIPRNLTKNYLIYTLKAIQEVFGSSSYIFLNEKANFQHPRLWPIFCHFAKLNTFEGFFTFLIRPNLI